MISDRLAIYAGAIEHRAAGDASRALVHRARAVLADALGEPIRRAHERLGPAFFAAFTAARRRIGADEAILEATRAVMREAGFDPEAHATDRLRVRANVPGGHRNPAAAAAYVAHRDTWYANPRAQINWWIPLHDVIAEETFVIYPECFARPVANTSPAFDYDAWIRRVGWQSERRDPDAAYPAALEDLSGERRHAVACGEGDVVLFAAAHLHQTRGFDGADTRFSVDFRTVCLEDRARGLGAPNVDDRSTGSALADYVAPLWRGA